ncbi:hypothetical protein BCSAG_49850 [Bacillus cereus]
MRDMLNLQALKHSKRTKHQTIYEKAHRMISQDWETKELTEEEILEIASRYPTLKVKALVGGTTIVRSKKDTWVIRDEARFYTLYHQGLSFVKGKTREKYHVQDIFYDMEFIFASIVSHDDYALGIASRTTSEILEIIEQSKEKAVVTH